MSQVKKVFMLLRENPKMTNTELQVALGYSNQAIRKYRWLLKKRGYIAENEDGEGVKILMDYREDSDVGPSFKQEIYVEMVKTYMDDFIAQERFKDRVLVGREIRLLLEAL